MPLDFISFLEKGIRMQIVFPMAGLSSRFTKAGFEKPKYMLDINNNTVFYHAINSFKRYFNEHQFLFIFRDIQDTKGFINEECQKLGLENYKVVCLDMPTDGQAETVFIGLKKANVSVAESILIFNIDTFRPNFELPQKLNLASIDGYLEVFEAEGDHWSFVLPESESSNKVIKTTEKDRISSLCSSGLYYFREAIDYFNTFETIIETNDRTKNEFYISPMYNYLIKQGKDIRYAQISIDEIIFCGTPNEYEAVKELNLN